jgi:hypothetical protein
VNEAERRLSADGYPAVALRVALARIICESPGAYHVPFERCTPVTRQECLHLADALIAAGVTLPGHPSH